MKRIEGKSVENMEDGILNLMREIYEESGGAYPALEWTKKKPVPGEDGWVAAFEGIYRPFLRYRLKEDVDMLLAETDADDENLAGVIGLKYTRKGSFPGYERLFQHAGLEMPENAAFLEMLAVHPAVRRKGIGRKLLSEAIHILNGMGKTAYGVSFPWLKPALGLYSSAGARIAGEVHGYSWSEDEEPSDYLIIVF